MKNVQIELAEGTFDDVVHITSPSKFSAWRIPKSSYKKYKLELSANGVYIYIIDTTTIYVGQSSNLSERGTGSHTEDIHKFWHTIVAFPCSGYLSKNELEHIENALCEYFYSNKMNLCNRSPKEDICNEQGRFDHYHLSQQSTCICNGYVEDIKHYISLLRDSHFYNTPNNTTTFSSETAFTASDLPVITQSGNEQVHIFEYINKRRDAHGILEVHFISEKVSYCVLKKGTKISSSFAPCCRHPQKLQKRRQQYELKGIIRDRILLEDIPWTTPSDALYFVNAGSNDALVDWKTPAQKRLAEFLSC